MSKAQDRSIIKRFLNSWFMIVIYLVLFVLIMREVVDLSTKLARTKGIYDSAYSDFKNQEAKTNAAKANLDLISSNRGIEGYIRETYPVVKEGEKVIVLFDSKQSAVEPVELPPTRAEVLKTWLHSLYSKVKIESNSN